MLILAGAGAASYWSYTSGGDLPTWVKIAGPVAAVVLLVLSRMVDGGSGFTSLGDRGVEEEPTENGDSTTTPS